jgi:hypothetical protein
LEDVDFFAHKRSDVCSFKPGTSGACRCEGARLLLLWPDDETLRQPTQLNLEPALNVLQHFSQRLQQLSDQQAAGAAEVADDLAAFSRLQPCAGFISKALKALTDPARPGQKRQLGASAEASKRPRAAAAGGELAALVTSDVRSLVSTVLLVHPFVAC